jgi:hypothetical protein
MARFAVLDGRNIINVIVADSKNIAETVTKKTCIEDINDEAEVGGNYYNGVFTKKQPYNSWTLDNNNIWQPPTPRPAVNPMLYSWNESTSDWDLIPTEAIPNEESETN